MKHARDVTENTQDDVDEQVHAHASRHQDRERRKNDGNYVGNDLGAVHGWCLCVVVFGCRGQWWFNGISEAREKKKNRVVKRRKGWEGSQKAG